MPARRATCAKMGTSGLNVSTSATPAPAVAVGDGARRRENAYARNGSTVPGVRCAWWGSMERTALISATRPRIAVEKAGARVMGQDRCASATRGTAEMPAGSARTGCFRRIAGPLASGTRPAPATVGVCQMGAANAPLDGAGTIVPCAPQGGMAYRAKRLAGRPRAVEAPAGARQMDVSASNTLPGRTACHARP